MYFPQHYEVARNREMTTVFGGYNHKLSCAEGEFYDMKNMTTDYFPILSPRTKRRKAWPVENECFGMLSTGDDLYWTDFLKLYRNGEDISGNVTIGASFFSYNSMPKMGTDIVFAEGTLGTFAYNTETDEFKGIHRVISVGGIGIYPCKEDGTIIYAKESTEDPVDGEYRLSWVDGKQVYRQWSKATSTWTTINSVYVLLDASNLESNNGFKVGDCMKITIDNSEGDFDKVISLFPQDEGDGKYSLETYIVAMPQENGKSTGVVFPGVIYESLKTEKDFKIERYIPSMDFVVECDNRLWGVAISGHEIYSCKLGDYLNWRVFRGISTDSYAVNIGSDGIFTGAITYLNTPIFFKENSMIRVYPSATGAHQIKETRCRGVQYYCHKSLCVVNEVLYYKSNDCICAFDGSLPVSISENFGEVRYEVAAAGTIGNKYYINMREVGGNFHTFVYDTVKGIWTKEDDIRVNHFCRHANDLFMDAGTQLYTVRGTAMFEGAEEEEDFDWYAESGMIGFNTPDNKYVSKITVRLSMAMGTNVDFYMQYDSSGTWEHIFNLNGTGTKSINIPVLPRRCDHFRYKIAGRGDCKIYSITKTIEEGSDVR